MNSHTYHLQQWHNDPCNVSVLSSHIFFVSVKNISTVQGKTMDSFPLTGVIWQLFDLLKGQHQGQRNCMAIWGTCTRLAWCGWVRIYIQTRADDRRWMQVLCLYTPTVEIWRGPPGDWFVRQLDCIKVSGGIYFHSYWWTVMKFKFRRHDLHLVSLFQTYIFL